MNTFGTYFPNDLFVLVNGITLEMAALETDLWLRNSAKIAPNHDDRDDVLSLLEPFYETERQQLPNRHTPCFEYVAKNSKAAAILIDNLKESLYPRTSDVRNGFQRINFGTQS
jgi:hypothetical protein